MLKLMKVMKRLERVKAVPGVGRDVDADEDQDNPGRPRLVAKKRKNNGNSAQ